LEVAKTLVQRGYCVVANSRNITSSKKLRCADNLKLVDGDISLREAATAVVTAAVTAAVRHFGTVDLLVNNAGVFIAKPFTEYTPEDFRKVTEVNLAGFFYVSQFAVARMRLQGSGHVVNISTSLASQPIVGVSASLANLTKGGLESITRALAIEFASVGIRFNTIAPGVVNTPMRHGVCRPVSDPEGKQEAGNPRLGRRRQCEPCAIARKVGVIGGKARGPVHRPKFCAVVASVRQEKQGNSENGFGG
jgi:NAD(P)-dependent dehydrogenase (short-subunit alcohol dehydrogenase family)